MQTPKKINMRDLSPELQQLINGEEASQEYMNTILRDFRRKDEVIQESDIDNVYRATINNRINNLRIELENFINDLGVISSDRFSQEFIQRIETIETKVQALGAYEGNTTKIQNLESQLGELERLISGESGVSNHLNEIDEAFSQIQQKLIDLKTDNNTLEQIISEYAANLDNKRGKDEKIDIDDLTDDLAQKMLSSGSVADELASIRAQLPSISGLKPGQYVGVDENGKISSKTMFYPIKVVSNESEVSEMDASVAETSVIVMSDSDDYIFYLLEETVLNSGEGQVKKLSKVENYFSTEPSSWNTFVVNVDNGDIVAIILNGGVFVNLDLFMSRKKSVKEYTISGNDSETFSRPNCLQREEVSILVKNSDGSYSHPLEDVVEIRYMEDEYKIKNKSSSSIDIIIRG